MVYENLSRTIKRRYLDLKPENTSKRINFRINTSKLLSTQPHEKKSAAIRNFFKKEIFSVLLLFFRALSQNVLIKKTEAGRFNSMHKRNNEILTKARIQHFKGTLWKLFTQANFFSVFRCAVLIQIVTLSSHGPLRGWVGWRKVLLGRSHSGKRDISLFLF